MKIPSSEIPQADTFEQVLNTVHAVNKGARTDRDIARFIHMVDRQGRYYRAAAELLGLVRNAGNNAELTDLGKKFVSSDEWSKKEIARNAVLNAHVFQRMLPFFELYPNGATRKEIENFIQEVTPTTESMIHRRTSTLLSWLQEVGVLESDGKVYEIRPFHTYQNPILQFPDEEPLAPKSLTLNEYKTVQERTERARETIKVLIDQAKYDRANAVHRSLVNIVADKLRASDLIPRNNRFVDLAATEGTQSYLFEMKSVNAENTHSQIRAGLSQLYEYRYLQHLPETKMVLVISEPLNKKHSWMQEYLEEDRKIHLVWDGSNQLFASKDTKQELSFLWR